MINTFLLEPSVENKSIVAGEKMQCLDYLCCASELLQVLGMSISAQGRLNVNTTVDKMASGLIYGHLQGVLERR